MNNSVKVILLSQIPLPYSKIGSWTTLYKNYLEKEHKIDYIVCPEPKELFEGIKYSFVNFTFISKLRSKLLRRKNLEYFQALDKLINSHERYIIQVVDNYGMIKPLKKYLLSKGISDKCYIQFFYHGYMPYNQMNSTKGFYESVNEIVLLTKDSYKEHKRQINILPSYFSILPNGIDNEKFKKVSDSHKIILKQELNLSDKKVFLWCSNDRPKKGLNLILEVWKNIQEKNNNVLLLIVGNDPREQMDGVIFLGKIQNEELPKYYQISDCYLFPTLCQEGFGLSLIEALHCGNYCIASALGGVPEVLQYGKLGKLIENPHFISEWVEAINEYLDKKLENTTFSDELYSMKNWNNSMNEIIENAKLRLHNNF